MGEGRKVEVHNNETRPQPPETIGRSHWSRFGLGLPVAGLITIGLCLVMAKLIATEFTPQEKLPTLKFTLNPVPDDIKVSPERTKLEPLKDIEIPPAPPSVSTIEAKKVVVGPVTARDAKTLFNPAVFKINPTTLIRVDGNPDPYLRLPPAMPSRATRSGHCDVRLNVDATGSPYKVEALYCTQSLFERPTVKAVEKWKYRPRIVDGRPVPMEGVTNRVSFHLIDERGSLIPESL